MANLTNSNQLIGKFAQIESDISNIREAIPADGVGEGVVSLKLNDTAVDSFNVNQSTNKTINSNVDKVAIGLGNVDNTSDLDKPISTAAWIELDKKANKSDLTTVYRYMGSVANASELPTEDQNVGDVYNLEDTGMNVAWNGTEWDELGSTVDLSNYYDKDEVDNLLDQKADASDIPTVNDGTLDIQLNGTSVETFSANSENNKTANIEVTKSTVGLGNVDNTSDANKPISTATQAALDLKADKTELPTVNDARITVQKNSESVDSFTLNQNTDNTINITINKTDVGLENVDNTSDLNKPISTATQAALDLKADKTDLDDYYKKTETYNKTEADALLDDKADKSTTYTKTEVDGKLDLKADKTELGDYYKKTETYNKTEVDGKLDLKADKTELGDYYKKTETYSQTEVDALLDDKADKSTTYTKTEVDGKLAEKQDVLTAGDGISIANKVISNTGVLTVNGEDGDVVVNDVKKSATAPANPTEGMVWYDTTNDILKTYDGTDWNEVGAGTGDIKYEDFEFVTMTGTVIENLSATKSISADTTLTAGSSLKEGMQYLVVVSNTDTAKHTVTFGSDSVEIEAGESAKLVFLATSSSTLELQVCTGGGGGGETPGDGKLTINQKGTKKGEFTANQATDVTVDIDADMSYEDFNFSAKTGTTVALDLNTSISPSSNITVNKPATLKEGQTYILRVSPTANMSITLGSGITNPFSVDLSLVANSVNQFVFLATSSTELELQPEMLTRDDIDEILRSHGLIS